MANRITNAVLDLHRELRTPQGVAALFCDMNDDEQTVFFAEVYRLMGTWTEGGGRTMQLHYIAGHANTCACGADARELILELADNIRGGADHA